MLMEMEIDGVQGKVGRVEETNGAPTAGRKDIALAEPAPTAETTA